MSYHDPIIPYLHIDSIKLSSLALTKENAARFDCVVIATDHTGVDYPLILKAAQSIFDLRNVYKGVENRKVMRL